MYLHAAVDTADGGDLVGAVVSDAAAQSADDHLVLLAVQAERVVMLRAAFGRGVARPIHLPQRLDEASQRVVERGAQAVDGAAAHRALELTQRVQVQGADAGAAVGVSALKHQRLGEHL